MIRIEHLKKAYAVDIPLKDVNAEIHKGDVISVIGPSGTGKSTLIRCINLLEQPTAGKIFVNGEEITAKGCDVARVRRKMGMVFQHFNLFPHLTIQQNITLAPTMLKIMSTEEANENALRLLTEALNTFSALFRGDYEAFWNGIVEFTEDVLNTLTFGAYGWGKDLVSSLMNGLREKLPQLKETISDVAKTVKRFIHFSEPDEGPLSNFHTYAPDMMRLFAQGIKDNEGLVRSQMERSFALPEQNNMKYQPASMPTRLVGVNEGTLQALSDASGSGSNGRPVTVVLQMNETEWGRGVFRLYEQEKQRIGVRLAKGAV